MGFNLLLRDGETQEVVGMVVLSKAVVKHRYVDKAIIHRHPRDTLHIPNEEVLSLSHLCPI